MYSVSGKSIQSFFHTYLRKKSIDNYKDYEMAHSANRQSSFGTAVFKINSQVTLFRKGTGSSRYMMDDVMECRISLGALSISDKPQDMSAVSIKQ